MADLLLTVLILQVAIHLVNKVGVSAINELLWHLYNKISTSTSSTAKQCNKLRVETVRLEREMNATSAQDDFAKWAKIRRQHDKTMAEYDKVSASLNSAKSKFTATASTLRWVLTSGARLLILFWYARIPIFWMPKGWLPVYFEWIVAFPKAPMGSVSIVTWDLACSSVIGAVADGAGAAWTLAMGEEPETAAKVQHAASGMTDRGKAMKQ